MSKVRKTPYARATSAGSKVPDDEAERERQIRAEWITADGGFVNDDFIKNLLSSSAPKLLHEQVRKANFNTEVGEGKASEHARPKADTTSKNHKSSKTTISEEVVRKHFPKALPMVDLVTPGLVEFVEDEMHFTPKQTLHAHASCANDVPLRLANNYSACFLGQHVVLGGVGGIPLSETCRVMAERASLYGCKVIITYQSHCSVSANGTFDFIELADKATDLRIESQCCEPFIKELNRFVHFGPRHGEKKQDETGMFCKSDSEDAAREKDMICSILTKHQDRLKHTKDPPLIELPRIVYEEIRDRLIRAIVPYLEVPALLIGGIHIHTPPDIDDYFHVINVDYLRSLSMRKQGVRSQEGDAGSKVEEGNKANDSDSMPTPRSIYSDDEEDDDGEDGSDKEGSGVASKESEFLDESERIRANPQNELLSKKSAFYALMKRRIVAFQASMRGTTAVEEAMQMFEDRKWSENANSAKSESLRRQEDTRRNEDWGFKDGDDKVSAKDKVTKWFKAFRWSRLVRRMMEEMRRSEIADEWNLDENDLDHGSSQYVQKKKMGAFFMTLRWNRLVKLALARHELKERRERLHFY